MSSDAPERTCRSIINDFHPQSSYTQRGALEVIISSDRSVYNPHEPGLGRTNSDVEGSCDYEKSSAPDSPSRRHGHFAQKPEHFERRHFKYPRGYGLVHNSR